MTDIGQDGNVEYRQLHSHDLKRVAVVAQALDNQWVSRATLASMLKRSRNQSPWDRLLGRRHIIGLDDVRAERERIGRMEYRRALINTEQVVINRAYLLNNDFVSDDYLLPGDEREALKELLAGDRPVIVPFFFRERSPIEPPEGMHLRPGVFPAWTIVCEETRTNALRLDWNDALNRRAAGEMALRFMFWLQSLKTFTYQARQDAFDAIVHDLGLPDAAREPFKRRLIEVSQWADKLGDRVTRQAFYQEFVLAPNTSTADGKYDPYKPFSAELKQLADLSYNINLPDALGRFPLTPMDSLPRTSLQELSITFQQPLISETNLLRLLENAAFSLTQGGLYLESMGQLSLRDVIRIRNTSQWADYISELRTLLDDPFSFSTHAQRVYSRYIELAGAMTDYVKQEKVAKGMAKLERWVPALRLAISIGARTVFATWHPLGASAPAELTYNILESDAVAGKLTGGAVATARLIIGGAAERNSMAALETSIDFARGRLNNAQGAWEEIIGRLRSMNFVQEPDEYAQSADEYDPNISYKETPTGIGSDAAS